MEKLAAGVAESQGMKGKSTSGGRKVRLARGHRLQKDPRWSGEVLLCPSGPIHLNATAAAILELCDGSYTYEEIVARVVRSGNESLAADIRAFLDSARRRGWIVTA
jgi:pyrroloquinoline quinone biosynthesis protein D